MNEPEGARAVPEELSKLAPIVIGTTSLSAGERKKLHTLESTIDAGIRAFRDVGEALLEIRNSRLYRETHTSFESYLQDRWHYERARGYQIMDAAGMVAALPEGKQGMIQNEAQARALAPILRERGVGAVERILDSVRERGVPITAPLIRRVAQEQLHPNQVEPSITERLVRDFHRLASSYQQWLATGPTRKEKTTVRSAVDQLNQVLS